MSYISDGLPLLFPPGDHRGTLAQAIKDVGSATQAYDMFLYTAGVLLNDQVIAILKMSRAITIPANLVGTQVLAGTFPTAPAILSVKKNSVEFGTITIAADGTSVFASTLTALAVGDVLSVVGPANADLTLANLAITLVGALAS